MHQSRLTTTISRFRASHKRMGAAQKGLLPEVVKPGWPLRDHKNFGNREAVQMAFHRWMIVPSLRECLAVELDPR
jgi:hypothetical protein